ncbi:hypothetical protein [Synoicihabitans lomoniglobus]|uniref:Uncharacterized protein n=1 Tax=Synoicihabitans lomoniglobus TaxID=2909285 RepID=A0AAF0CN45_9BACT|nr:hypothetical protein [Opitutaceae bacterium LMO-M01]WED65028.1 hypothetical protein PXH66_21985 [Opitutaceae bacterium LMO-M01]
MNNQNILYALIGGAVVALAWIVSIAVSAQAVAIAFTVFVAIAFLALFVQDYRLTDKLLK